MSASFTSLHNPPLAEDEGAGTIQKAKPASSPLILWSSDSLARAPRF